MLPVSVNGKFIKLLQRYHHVGRYETHQFSRKCSFIIVVRAGCSVGGWGILRYCAFLSFTNLTSCCKIFISPIMQSVCMQCVCIVWAERNRMGGYLRAGAHTLVNLQAGYCTGSDMNTHIAHNIHPICHLGPGRGWSNASSVYFWTHSASHTKQHLATFKPHFCDSVCYQMKSWTTIYGITCQ